MRVDTRLSGCTSVCAFVMFAAGLFKTTFDRLSSQPFGFSYDRVLALVVDAHDDRPRAVRWMQMRETAAHLPGVESAAVAGWPLLSGWNACMIHTPRCRSWPGT